MATGARRPIVAEDLFRLRIVADPQIAPDGASALCVVRVVDAEKNKYFSHLWRVPVDGGPPRAYTHGEQRDSTPRWSPDGTRIAFISDRKKPAQIWLLPADGGEARPLTSLEEGEIGDLAWSPDGRRLAIAFRPRPEEEGEKAREEREKAGKSRPPRVLRRLRYREEAHGYRGNERWHIFVVDAETGTATAVTAGDFDHGSPAWSPDGDHIAFTENHSPDADLDPNRIDLFVVDANGGEPRLIATPPGPISAPTWSPDGKEIAYVAHGDVEDRWGLSNAHVCSVSADGGPVHDWMPNLDRPMGDATLSDTQSFGGGRPGPVWSADGTRLFFLVSDRGTCQLYQAPRDGAPTPLTAGPIDVGAFSADRATRRAALLMGSATELSDLYALDLETAPGAGRRTTDHRPPTTDGPDASQGLRPNAQGLTPNARRLTEFNRAFLDEVHVAVPEELTMPTPDGTEVHGWLLKPPDHAPGRRYPLILEIHGGPHTQYGCAFFHEMQCLAARGYLVLYTNPRGSKGYGEAHTRAIRANWGGPDYTDLMAAVDFIVQRDDVDPARLGVTGGSYGGYMTNWIVGHTDRFKAAVTQRSVTNLHSMAGTCDFTFEDRGYFNANAWDTPGEYLRMSPLTYAANVRTPLLILHSEGDLRCPMEQAEQWFAALRHLRREVEFVRFPAEANHGLSRSGPPDLRMARLGFIFEWMDRYLK